MTGASSRISTPASRAARGVRQGETRRANLELALLAAALVAFLLAVARVAAGHAIGAPGAGRRRRRRPHLVGVHVRAEPLRRHRHRRLPGRACRSPAVGRHRRSVDPADRLRAVRPRPADDGQRQRSVARAAAVPAVRDRRGDRLRRADRRQPGRLRASRAAPLRLRVPDGRARPVGAAARIRLGPRPQRRQGQPVRRAAGRSDPAARRAVPGRLLRAAVGVAARAGRAAGAAAPHPEAPAPAPRRRPDPGRRRHGAGAAVLLLPARPRAGAGPRLHVPRHLQRRARPLGPGRAGPGHAGRRVHRGVPRRLSVHGGQAHRHVAVAVGQRRQRRRSGRARALGPGVGRALRRRPVRDEPALHPDRRERSRARQPRRDPRLRRRRAGPRAVRRARGAGAAHRASHRSALRRAAGRRAGDVARRAGAADRRRPARPAAALRRGHAVPQPGPIVDGVEPRRRRAAAGRVAAGAAGRGEAIPAPGIATRAGRLGAARHRGGPRVHGADLVARRHHDPADADAAGGRRGAAAGQPAPARSGAAGPARRDPRSPRPAHRHGLDARRQRARQGVRRDRRQPVRDDARGRGANDGARIDGPRHRASRHGGEDSRRAVLSARRRRLPPARRRGVQGQLGGAELGVRGARVRHAAARLQGLRASCSRCGITATSRST